MTQLLWHENGIILANCQLAVNSRRNCEGARYTISGSEQQFSQLIPLLSCRLLT